jgi:hypothetical protein
MFARLFFPVFLGFFALLAAGPVQPALAQPGPGRGGVQPLDRLLPGIRRGHPGNFYDAEGPTYGPAGDPHYHLKWMTPDGRVIWYDTDARNGRVLRSSPGRDSFDDPRDYPGPHAYSRRYPSYARPYGYDGGRFGPPPPGYVRPFRGWHHGRGWRHR